MKQEPNSRRAARADARERIPASSGRGGRQETFNSDSAAEKHRAGRPGIDRRCLPPADAGLVPVEHSWGTCWQAPGTDLRFTDAQAADAA